MATKTFGGARLDKKFDGQGTESTEDHCLPCQIGRRNCSHCIRSNNQQANE
jgi:hypothetical protein